MTFYNLFNFFIFELINNFCIQIKVNKNCNFYSLILLNVIKVLLTNLNTKTYVATCKKVITIRTLVSFKKYAFILITKT